MSETIAIGPCKCGGYGQVFDAATERRRGRCHRDLSGSAYLDEVALTAARKVAPHLPGSINEVTQLKARIQVAVRDALDETIVEIERQQAVIAELVEGLRLVVRQNSLDMLLTGDELRRCSALIAKHEVKPTQSSVKEE